MTGMADLVKVWVGNDHFEGEVLRSRLQDEGIDVLLKGEGGGVYHVGPTYLFVTAADEQRARTVLAAVAAGDYALDEDVEPTST